MTRVLRRLGGLLLLLIALPPLLLAGLLLAANAPPGLALLERVAAAAVPGLTIEGLSGPLPASLRARRITLADEAGVWLEAEAVDLHLDWLALARRTARIDHLTAGRLVLHRLPPGDPAAEPTAPALPSLPLAVDLGALRLAELVLDQAVVGLGLRASVEGAGILRPDGVTARLAGQRLDAPGSAGLTLDWRPATGRLVADLRVEEPEGGLASALLGRAEAPAHVALRLDGPVAGAPFQLDASLGDDRLAAEGQVGVVDGAAELSLTASGPAETRLAARLRRAADGAIAIGEARLSAPQGSVSLSGDLSASGALALDWTAEATPAALALLPPGPRFATASATGRLTGTLGAPVLAASLRLTDPATGIAPADPLLGAAASLTLSATRGSATAALSAAGITAQADATFTLDRLAETLAGQASVTLPELSLLGPGFAGAIRAEAGLTGGLVAGQARLSASGQAVTLAGTALAAPDLTARLRLANSLPAAAEIAGSATWGDLPLTLSLRGVPEGAALRIEAARATAGAASAEAEGLIDPATRRATGTASLAVPDLAALVPGLPPGRLTAQLQGNATDDRQGLTLRAEAALRDGTTARLDIGGDTGLLTLDGSASGAGLRATLRGTASPTERVLDLTSLEVQRDGTPPLRLLRPARLRQAEAGPVLEALSLGLGSGRIDAAGPLKGQVAVTLRAIPLEGLAPFPGKIDGTVTIEAAARARFALTGTGLAPPGLPPLTARVEGEASAAGARLRATADAGQAGRVEGSATLSGFTPASAIAADLRGSLDVARLAAPFLGGGADRVAGRVALDLRLGGTLAAPRPEGSATLTGGSWRNAAVGGAVTDIAGRFRFADQGLRIDSLTGRTPGGGTLAIEGSLDPLADGLPAALRLTARNARPATGPYGSVVFDADLTLDGPVLGAATLGGRLLVTRANLLIPDLLPASIPQLPGVRTRGQRPAGAAPIAPPPPPGTALRSGPAWILAVQLDAPQRVLVSGRGLDVELGGSIALRGTLNAPQTDGELTLRRGTVALPTRRLAFQRGTLKFLGDPIPELNLSAGSESGGTSVAIEVTGPATAPVIAITSNPSLPPDEAMALLLFGRSGQRLSATEAIQAAQALAQLSGNPELGAGGFLSRIGQALGLDRLGIGTSASGAAGVDAGRYIAPGLYLGIRPGTDGALPGVAAQWDLTPRLRLEAETSRGAGGERVGLGYELEY